MKQNKSITVGIPTFNSAKYLNSCLRSVVNSNVVNEIIVSDDYSNTEQFQQTKEIFNLYKRKTDKSLILHRNTSNLGAYENKFNIFSYSSNNMIYILDSDNIAAQNIDFIFERILKLKDKNYLFQPNTMYQFWKYPKINKFQSKFQKKYKVNFLNEDGEIDLIKAKKSLILDSGGYDIEKYIIENNLHNLYQNEKNFIEDKWIAWVLNCGNFIVDKNIMIDIAKEGLNYDRKLRSVDAIVFSYLWLKAGKKIKLYKDFYHHHRKRTDSVSFIEKEESPKAIEYFISQILKNG